MAAVENFALASAAARTSTGTQDFTVTGLGWTPKAAIFFISQATTANTAANGLGLCVGGTDGLQDRSGSASSKDAVTLSGGTPSVCKYRNTDLKCISLLEHGGTLDATATFDSWINNGTDFGVRVNWDDAPANAVIVKCLLIGGASVSNIFVAQKATLGGSTDETAPGFKPDIVFAWSSGGAPDETITNDMQMCFGAAVRGSGDTVTQACIAIGEVNGRTTRTQCQTFASSTTNAKLLYSVSESVTSSTALTSWLSNGFHLTGTAGFRVQYCAIKFDGDLVQRGYVGIVTSPTGTGNADYTGPAFRPNCAILVSSTTQSTDTTDATSDSLAFGIGIAAGSTPTEGSISVASEDNVLTSNTQSLVDSKVINTPLPSGASGLVGSASWLAGGLRVNFSSTLAAARELLLIAVSQRYEASFTGTGTLAGTLTGAGAMSAATSGSGTLAGLLKGTGALVSNVTGTGTLSGTVTGAGAMVAACTGTGTLAGTAIGAAAMTSAMSGTGTLSGTLTGLADASAALAATGSISGTLLGAAAAVANATGTGTLSGTLLADAAMASGLTGTGTLSGTLTASLSPVPASLILTGQVAQLVETIPVAPTALVLTGQVPNVASAPSGTLIVTPASLVLTGQRAVLVTTISATTATLTLTGQTPLLAKVILPSPATLTLTGSVAVLVKVIPVTPAALSLTGSTPALKAVVPVTPGALTLTGQVPAVSSTQNNYASPAPAALILSGQIPLVTSGGNVTIVAIPAALVLTGQVPVINPILFIVSARVGVARSVSRIGAITTSLSGQRGVRRGVALLRERKL